MHVSYAIDFFFSGFFKILVSYSPLPCEATRTTDGMLAKLTSPRFAVQKEPLRFEIIVLYQIHFVAYYARLTNWVS